MSFRNATVAALLLAACGAPSRSIAPIHLEPIIALGDSAGPHVFHGNAKVSELHPHGFRVLLPQLGGSHLLPMRYDSAGNFLGTVGRWGADSAGFEKPLFTRFGPGDSIYIFDASRRVLVFDAQGKFGRSITLSMDAWDALVLANGSLVVTSAHADDPVGLMIVPRNGESARTIVDSAAKKGLRRLIRRPNGELWLLSLQGGWRMEVWDTLVGFRRGVDRDVEWYHPYASYHGPTATTPPLPTLMDGWFDEAGRLWVVGQLADPRWKEGVAVTSTTTDGPPGVVIQNADRVFDTMVEVLDPDTGALLAETRFDQAFGFVAGPGVVARIVDAATGGRRVELYRVRLNGKG